MGPTVARRNQNCEDEEERAVDGKVAEVDERKEPTMHRAPRDSHWISTWPNDGHSLLKQPSYLFPPSPVLPEDPLKRRNKAGCV